MTGKEDKRLENARELIHNYEEKVIGKLFPETNGKSIKEGTFSIERSLGNPSRIHYVVTDIADGKNYTFSARMYRATPKTYKGEISQAQKDYKSYLFLKERAGIEHAPRAVFLEEAPEWLFKEFIVGETLRDILDKDQEEKARMKTLDEFLMPIVASIANYQSKATYAAQSLPVEERTKLLWSRSVEEQAKDYLTAYIGDKEEAADVAANLYIPLIGEALRGVSVCHGDLSPDNIIYNEEKKAFYFIDHELKERNPFADLGCFIAYLGNYEGLWKKLAEKFKLIKTGLAMKEEGIKLTKLPIMAEPYKLEEKAKKDAHFELYANILHHSLRRVSKYIQRGEKGYDGQIKNIEFILNSWTNSQADFNLAESDIEKINGLKKYFPREKESNHAEAGQPGNQAQAEVYINVRAGEAAQNRKIA